MGADLTARAAAPPAVVEFTGLPGSGKSTIAHALAWDLRARDVEVAEPTRDTDRLPSVRARRLRKLRIAAISGMWGAGRTGLAASAILGSSQAHAAGRLKGLINWFYLAGLYRRAASGPGITLLDQGLLQAVWSIAYGTSSTARIAPEVWADLVGGILPSGSVAVVVEADDDAVRRRLAARRGGASRIDHALAGPEGAFEQALARGREALDVVERVAERLSSRGSLEVIRIDTGTSDSATQARRLSRELMSE